jgi:predicted negative regulator of RcsB-dependent stress response
MYDLEEQEKIDELKRFWKENGRLIIAAAIAFLVAVAGVQGWLHYQRSQAEAAAALFGKLEQAQAKNDVTEIRNVGGEILAKYGSTAYGPMSALVLAKVNYDAGDRAAAATQLQWVLDHGAEEEVSALARLRLAGIRLDEKKFDEALRLLDAKAPQSFAPLYADLRGDVLVAQGKPAEARAAYKQALEKIPSESPWRRIVQVKLDALGSGQ